MKNYRITVYFRNTKNSATLFEEAKSVDNLWDMCFYKIPNTNILVGVYLEPWDDVVSKIEIEEID